MGSPLVQLNNLYICDCLQLKKRSIWSTILIFIDRDENRSGKSCSGRCCIHIFPPVFCFLRKIRIQNGTRKTEPAHQEQLNKNGTGKSWRILLTVLIMKKTGLKTIEAFSWLFCQYPCSIFIQEFTPAFSFLLVASSFDTATLDHLRPETYTTQAVLLWWYWEKKTCVSDKKKLVAGSCMRSAARQRPVASYGLWHGSAWIAFD